MSVIHKNYKNLTVNLSRCEMKIDEPVLRVTVLHHEEYRVMPSSDYDGRICLYLTLMIDSLWVLMLELNKCCH